MLGSADCGSLFAVLGDVGCVDGRDLSFWCSWLRRFFLVMFACWLLWCRAVRWHCFHWCVTCCLVCLRVFVCFWLWRLLVFGCLC